MTVKLKDIEVQWYEGLRLEDYGNSPAFDRWNAFQLFLERVFNEDQKYRKEKGLSKGGYIKVKAKIIWEDGTTLVDRIDVGLSDGDFTPNEGYVGNYLRYQNQAMYESDFSSDKPRTNYSWEDEEDEDSKEEMEYRDAERNAGDESYYDPTQKNKDNFDLLWYRTNEAYSMWDEGEISDEVIISRFKKYCKEFLGVN
jgi:hypothetical protein